MILLILPNLTWTTVTGGVRNIITRGCASVSFVHLPNEVVTSRTASPRCRVAFSVVKPLAKVLGIACFVTKRAVALTCGDVKACVLTVEGILRQRGRAEHHDQSWSPNLVKHSHSFAFARQAATPCRQ